MARTKDTLTVTPASRTSRSRSRSPRPKSKNTPQKVDYTSDGVTDNDIFNLPLSDYRWLAGLTLVAAAVRLFRIYQPTSVVFDEVHFGGFATKYIKGRFFMDVHPPLAKLLITLAGWLAGFDGEFEFKNIGDDYIEPGVPYVAMRLLPAILGVLTVPLMFLTLKATGCRTSTSAMGALLVTFENALTTQSRFILLDSPLIFCTALTALCFSCFTNEQEQGPSKAFKAPWWFWLSTTGLSLGATLSVKWVGLFTIAWVGSLTLVQLWVLLGDPNTVTPRLWFKHFFARFFCLIVIPTAFYVSMFAIHFLCLVNPGEGDGFMSSEFQATLNSKGMQDVPADIAFGSRVSIRHLNTQGGYLHSHSHMYPTGSKQQQVTLYPHKDENNVFLLENQTQPLGPYGEIEGPLAWDNLTADWIYDGATIKLYHLLTHRRIHSHDERAPITEVDWQNEVSAYGYEGFPGDANDLFRVEIVQSISDGEEAKKRLRTIQTKFRLVHIMTGCTLFSHKVKLPDWAFDQQEVTCAKGGTLPNSIWYIESNTHPSLPPDAEKVNYRNPGFLGKFLELQKVMWTTNAGLTESHTWDSRPPSWPTLLRGINFWGKDHRQVYLLGNPLIWWSSTAAIAIYALFKGITIIRWQRGYNDYKNINIKRFDYELGTTILGWAFHYFPFYLMARQLFLHHYLPALYFSIMGLSQIFDFVFKRVQLPGLGKKSVLGSIVITVFLALSVAIFAVYSPLVYGNPWTESACNSVRLLSSWDFACDTFHTDLSKYTSPVLSVSNPTQSGAPAAAIPPNYKHDNNQQQIPNGQENQQSAVTSKPANSRIVSREERVEYRDEAGNILDPEKVAQLKKEGKISMQTKYETQTRILDADANGNFQKAEHAPPHPDVEGQNPETNRNGADNVARNEPASAVGMGKSIRDEKDQDSPRPASEGNEATR
ncbi:protein mannosyltransferase 1 [Talaromyces proteolyticus]|uniref:Dolichyl-phosphate-mannose--protein mannosyltransferase n=1 Tax=Talaromyces proteolyticus TaxID=1131652 RepID=A0AAD4Q555_9EURO|nr:protein mannosyltransferase 1 [Talaromyces proteolyticus]KAH8703819.1 protein mannosyltransferase 1 [Talaromyces proteolyticus]